MSQVLIQQYLRQLATLKKVGGTSRESVVREAFKDLLKAWGGSSDLTFIAECALEKKTQERRYVDGALLHTLRVPFGCWEAKDEKDPAIRKKFNTYRFADCKEKVVDLPARVTTVSVETQAIVEGMRKAPR